jgi:hypothetical protein
MSKLHSWLLSKENMLDYQPGPQLAKMFGQILNMSDVSQWTDASARNKHHAMIIGSCNSCNSRSAVFFILSQDSHEQLSSVF